MEKRPRSLDALHLTKGYMLTFNFNKKRKEKEVVRKTIKGKELIEYIA